MTTIKAFVRRRPLSTYGLLTFALSWGGFLLALGPGGFPGTKEKMETLFAGACIAMLVGPSVSGVLLTAAVSGKAGLREFRSRLFKGRVGARWYAAALLTAPLLLAAILLALSLHSPVFRPGILTAADKPAHLMFGLIVGLAAGVFEELGWTGFVLPRLRRRFGVLTAGLVLGILWAVWHELAAYWASGTSSGPLSLAAYLLDPFLLLVGFRMLMVWVYDRTGSLFVAMLMHVSLTASVRIFSPLAMTAANLLTLDLSWAAAMWIIVAALAAAGRRRLAPQPLEK